ncbi:MAG: hypothetical protein K8U57_37070 [Planctomycetes bacterium]|nr:hypothetical protein [Planctomycetota bacterium]
MSKSTKSGDAFLLANAIIGAVGMMLLAAALLSGAVKPEPRFPETQPVVLKPMAKPLPKQSKSDRIVALAALTPGCEVTDWACTLGEAQKAGIKFNKEGKVVK